MGGPKRAGGTTRHTRPQLWVPATVARRHSTRRRRCEDQNDIWIWEFAKGTLTRLTFERGPDQYPRWTSDGRRVVYASASERETAQTFAPFSRAADGTGTRDRLATFTGPLDQGSLSPDGKWLVMRTFPGGTNEDIIAISLDTNRRVEPLIHTPFGSAMPKSRPMVDGSHTSRTSQASIRSMSARFPPWRAESGRCRQPGVQNRSGPATAGRCFTSQVMVL